VFSVPHPVTSRVLANLLAFVAEQELDLEEEEVVVTLIQADFLGMREVVEECTEFIEERVCEENALGLWQLAQVYQLKTLEDACLRCLFFE